MEVEGQMDGARELARGACVCVRVMRIFGLEWRRWRKRCGPRGSRRVVIGVWLLPSRSPWRLLACLVLGCCLLVYLRVYLPWLRRRLLASWVTWMNRRGVGVAYLAHRCGPG
jgi:hypothetical protein